MSEQRRTENQTQLPTTGTTDTPNCTCCTPPQPLEAPATAGLYVCPVTGIRHMYDTAEGVVREAAQTSQPSSSATPAVTPVTTSPAASQEDNDFFPREPQPDKIRRVNPQDPFASCATEKIG